MYVGDGGDSLKHVQSLSCLIISAACFLINQPSDILSYCVSVFSADKLGCMLLLFPNAEKITPVPALVGLSFWVCVLPQLDIS